MSAKRELVLIAHRAGNETSLLRSAEAAGADVIEADVWFNDGALEVRHLKTMGPIPVLWDRWALRPGWTPRRQLDQLLAEAAASTRFMFDLKGTDPLLPEVLAEQMAAIAPERPYWVCSRGWDLLEPFQRRPGVQVVHSIGSERQLRDVWARLTWHTQHAISIHRKLLTSAAVAALKEKASVVVTWPVNSQADFELVRGLGVDGITSDSIELIGTLAEERARQWTTHPATG